MRLNVAILGCGDMGAEHAVAWDHQAGANIMAVCDPDVARCQRLAERYGAIGHGNWQDAICQDAIDVVSVCTPVSRHRELCVAAAQAGKHVLCEKPMALSLAEADDMIAAARANGVQLAVCHQYRGFGHFRTLKALIDDGSLGSPLAMRMTDWREVRPKLAMHRRDMNGGPVHDMSGHFFDLARFMTGSEAVRLSAVGGVLGADKPRLTEIDDPGIDSADIQARLEGGHVLSISIHWGLPEGTPEFSHVSVSGPAGYAQTANPLDGEFPADGNPVLKKAVVLSNGDGVHRIVDADYPRGPAICIADLVGAIRTGEPGVFDGQAGRRALELVLAALESVESGRGVNFSPTPAIR